MGNLTRLSQYFCAFSIAMMAVVTPHAYGQHGGSNYAWYHIDSNCNREPYGVLYNYDVAKTTIDAQLQDILNHGQNRLRIPILFGHGFASGTVMDSTGGNLSQRHRTNLTNFLATVRDLGFQEVEIGFFPVGSYNDPTQWSTYSEVQYQENWNVIYNLHSIIAQSGLLYRIDLQNEGTPYAFQTVLLQYAQHLWNDYVNVFGKDDTVGFSIATDVGRMETLPVVYGDSQYGNHGSPYLFDVHLYDRTSQTFVTVFDTLNRVGLGGKGWIIGEAYYNDQAQAASLRDAINTTGQTVYYVAQWPLNPDLACNGTGINIAPPVLFQNYLAYGF
jgi:hypothetical protein